MGAGVSSCSLARAVSKAGQLGVVKQRLGGDAPPIQTYPAELVALDTGGLEPQLGGANGPDLSPGPAADHDQVIVL